MLILQKVLADVEISNAIWCDHDDGLLGFFLVKCDAVDAGKDELACQENLEDFRKHFCSLNDTQRDFALKFVFTEVNKGLTVQGVSLPYLEVVELMARMKAPVVGYVRRYMKTGITTVFTRRFKPWPKI